MCTYIIRTITTDSGVYACVCIRICTYLCGRDFSLIMIGSLGNQLSPSVVIRWKIS